jgi:hypothetical protein
LKENKPQINNIRINIMMTKKKYYLFGKNYLSIDYSCPDYPQAEKEQRYYTDIGCCGSVLQYSEQIYYDSRLFQETLKGMSATQREITKNIGSILSSPIYSPYDKERKKPIGVLNIDSSHDINITGFNEKTIQQFTANRATLIGYLLI